MDQMKKNTEDKKTEFENEINSFEEVEATMRIGMETLIGQLRKFQNENKLKQEENEKGIKRLFPQMLEELDPLLKLGKEDLLQMLEEFAFELRNEAEKLAALEEKLLQVLSSIDG